MDEESKLLIICNGCNKIQTGQTWIDEKTSSEVYNKLLTEFGDRLTHGYCPVCGEQKDDENEQEKNPTRFLKIGDYRELKD